MVQRSFFDKKPSFPASLAPRSQPSLDDFIDTPIATETDLSQMHHILSLVVHQYLEQSRVYWEGEILKIDGKEGRYYRTYTLSPRTLIRGQKRIREISFSGTKITTYTPEGQ